MAAGVFHTVLGLVNAACHASLTLDTHLDPNHTDQHLIVLDNEPIARLLNVSTAPDDVIEPLVNTLLSLFTLWSNARHDTLTRVLSRAAILEEAQQAIIDAQRHNTPMGLVAFDIDFFKDVNDTHGHGVGDNVLVSVAQTLQKTIRSTDKLGRIGGEEFLLVCKGKAPDLVAVAQRCVDAVAANPHSQQNLHITVSAGWAAQVPHEALAGLLERADICLYMAKSLGKNRIHG